MTRMTIGKLHRYALNNSGKSLFKWVHYFDIYEEVFSRFCDTPVKMLEIGVLGGGSLEMWRDYLGPKSLIVGMDINEDCLRHKSERIEIVIGDQSDKRTLDDLIEKYGPFDIVLDDGSHQMEHMIASFEALYPALSTNGVYMVEDTHTSYWSKFGGGLKRADTFIEHAKALVDDLNASHTEGVVEVSDFTRHTQKISFYDSIVVFEKRLQGGRKTLKTQGM